MWQLGLLCIFIAGASAVPGYSGAGAGAGSYSGTGTGGTGGYYGFYPGIVPPYQGFGYNNDLQNFIKGQFVDLQNRFASIASSGNGVVSGASASGAIGPGGVYQSVSTYPGGTLSNRFGGTNGGGATYVSTSNGSPAGTTYVTSSNGGGTGILSNRFGGAGGATYTSSSNGGPGYSGISTFSSSDTSGNRQAVTSVNDNGKVTTYHTRN